MQRSIGNALFTGGRGGGAPSPLEVRVLRGDFIKKKNEPPVSGDDSLTFEESAQRAEREEPRG